MTEQEWLACTDPTVMLKRLRGKTSDRKRRLFAVACCKRFWQHLSHEPSRQAVEVAERYADGLASSRELEAAAAQAGHFIHTEGQTVLQLGGQTFTRERYYSHAAYASYVVASSEASYAARQVAQSNPSIDSDPSPAQEEATVAGARERAIWCDLLRDIFGPLLFRSLTINPSILAWNDTVVVRLAQAAYEERHLPEGTLDNSRLAILADALEEAGCTDADILDHFRGPGPHVRGCWPVDLCLGKS